MKTKFFKKCLLMLTLGLTLMSTNVSVHADSEPRIMVGIINAQGTTNGVTNHEEIYVGETFTLKAGAWINCEEVAVGSDINVYSIDDSGILSYTDNGDSITFKGLKTGSTDITLCLNSNNDIQCDFFVTVKEKEAVTPKLEDTAIKISKGSVVSVLIKNIADCPALEISSSNTKVCTAKIDGKYIKVTAKDYGSASITLKCTSNGKTKKATLKVTVKKEKVAKPTLSSSSAKVNIGNSKTIRIKNYSAINGATVTSSNTKVATVSKVSSTGDFTITGVAKGSCTVTIKGKNGGTNKVKVTVSSAKLKKPTLSDSAITAKTTVKKGSTVRIKNYSSCGKISIKPYASDVKVKSSTKNGHTFYTVTSNKSNAVATIELVPVTKGQKNYMDLKIKGIKKSGVLKVKVVNTVGSKEKANVLSIKVK